MTQITLKIDDLKPSPSNVRTQHTRKDVVMMADSIRMRGLINPPSVAKNGDGRYEVIAGLLRYKGAIEAGLDELVCDDVSHLTEVERIDISFSENQHRRSMTEMQEYLAYSKLFKAGMSVDEIGERFGNTQRGVQQRLAIGGLPKKILELYDNEDIGGRTLQALALAAAKDVTRYGKLKPKDRPRDWDIESWLDGDGGRYLATHALFDLEVYKGPKLTDLFNEDEVWLTDGDEFMRLQNLCIVSDVQAYEDRGWKVTEVSQWQGWAYDKTSKANGGEVFWCMSARTGAVEYHVGYARQKKTGAAPAAKGSDGKAQPKPAISQAFESYMAETRHNAVCQHIIKGKHGLVAAIILLIKQPDNISMQHQGSQVKGEDYVNSLDASMPSIGVRLEFVDMVKELAIPSQRWDVSIPKLTKALLEYKTAALQEFLSIIIARNWTINGPDKDSRAIGKALGLTQVDDWVADDAFWNGIKNKDTLIKIAKDCKIPIDKNATTKVIRSIVADKVSDDWRPSWLKF